MLDPKQTLKGKVIKMKASISSSNLEDNIAGVVGNKIQNR